MLYLTTAKLLLELPEDACGPEHTVTVFYKDSDVIKISDLSKLYEQHPNLQFMMVDGRDDILVCLGALLSSVDTCQFLDSSIPVPKRYEDKVITSGKKPARGRTRRGSGGRRKSDVSEPVVAETKEPDTPEAPFTGMPEPIVSEPESMDPVVPSGMDEAAVTVEPGVVPEEGIRMDGAFSQEIDGEMFSEESAAKLYQLLRIKSTDVGFAWDTQMLMLNLLRYLSTIQSDEELRGTVLGMRNGDLIWAKLEPVLVQAKTLAAE